MLVSKVNVARARSLVLSESVARDGQHQCQRENSYQKCRWLLIAAHSYHFVVAMWSTKGAQWNVAQGAGTMKLNPPGVTGATTCSSADWFSAVFCAALFTTMSASAAVSQTGTGGMNSTEKWVIAKAKAGEIADLSKQFPDEAKQKRKLSARFLEDLLVGALAGFKPHRNGVRITGATIDEPIDLTNAQIPCEAWLEHCQFMSSVTVNGASFAGVVSFDGSAFKADANFDEIKVGGSASFESAVFEGPVHFGWADVHGQFIADEAQFNDKEQGANFSGMKIGQKASFKKAMFKGPVNFQINVGGEFIADEAVFEGPANFVGADVRGHFGVSEAQFKDKKTGAIFTLMKVGQMALLTKAVFEGPVRFDFAEVAGSFTAQEAQFRDNGTGANFTLMKIGQIAHFTKAVFEGPVRFEAADIRGYFLAQQAQFKEKGTGVSFNLVKVGQYASFNQAVFEGPASFVGTEVAGQFQASQVLFKDKGTGVNFNSMKVGEIVFSKTVFEGPVNFLGGKIGDEFQADEAQFKDKEQGANFAGMKVGQTALFAKAVFEGPVIFFFTDVTGIFNAQGARFQNKEQSVTFIGMKVRRDALFYDAVFEGPVNFISADIAGDFSAQGAKFQNKQQGASFNSIKVGTAAFFKNTVFEGPVDFRDADFAWLDLSTPFWPKIAGQLDIRGMSYKYIQADSKVPESHNKLLELIKQSAYAANVSSNLEEFFRHQGYRGDADWAFIAGKCREREEYFHSGDWFHWLGSWILYLLVGYGRRPWLAAIPFAILVALGCFLFSPEKMEPQKPEDTHRVYNRFWYSLGLLLPVVDLQADKVWKPKANETFLRNYVRVHALLGWILIPIVLAALAGLIK